MSVDSSDTFDLWKSWKDGSISLTRDNKKEDVLLLPSLNGLETFFWLGERGFLRGAARQLWEEQNNRKSKIIPLEEQNIQRKGSTRKGSSKKQDQQLW